MAENEFDRYLRLLSIPAGPPSLESLGRIVRSHLATVPFENISKLVRLKITGQTAIPDFSEYLDDIEHHHFGGTCYTNNYYLNRLLAHLGYDVRLCGADMNRPDVHIVSVVSFGDHEYLVDVGYGAPFLKPIPRNLSDDFIVSRGIDRYLFKPQDSRGRTRLEYYRNGALRHGYVVNPAPRRFEEFGQVIADSFRPQGTFMNTILIVRFESNRSYVICNMEFVETLDGLSRQTVFRTSDELVDAIRRVFGMPPDLVRFALDGFPFQGNPYG